MKLSIDKFDYKPGEAVQITASEVEEGSALQFQVLNYGADGAKGTADDFLYRSWLVEDGGRGDTSAAAGEVGTQWIVPGTALDKNLELVAVQAGEDGQFGTGDDTHATVEFADAKPGGTTVANVSVSLDQWANGPVSEGDADSTGKNNETFVNGNLNAQKTHYNEGDSIPYRAYLDDLTTGVTYGLVIQWDTVESGAYALDYLTGYNFTNEGTKHPGEPDVTPLLGVGDISGGGVWQVLIPADSTLTSGFGPQYGITDGLASGQPSGNQYITIFGAVDPTSLATSGYTYSADGSKASLTIFFTYTGSTANNLDSVVVAWGGHIASSLDWRDDAGETVQTASDISGSPYHTRVLSLLENGVARSIGNQDRSLSADAVLPPLPPEAGNVQVVVDDDDTGDGIGDNATGDDQAFVSSTTLPVTDATSVDFADLHGDAVLDTGGTAVKSGGVALVYYWDGTGKVLYGTTDGSSLSAADTNKVFTVTLQNSAPGVFDYLVSLHDQVDHAAGNNENNVDIAITYTATGQGGTTTGDIQVSIDDDLPVRAANPTAVSASVEEDGMSLAAGADTGGLAGNDLSEGARQAGDTTADDMASGTAGSLSALFASGADEPLRTGLSSVTTSLPALYSRGTLLTYVSADTNGDQINDTLTASAGTRTVFTLRVNTDGSWLFDLDDQLDHVAGNGENMLLRTNASGTTSTGSIDFSAMVTATDYDGDTTAPLLAGDFSVAVQDDVPVVLNKTDVTYANADNPTPGGTGTFSYAIGSDERSTFASNNTDLLVSLTGVEVGGAAISSPSVTWVSETSAQAVFDFGFAYAPDPNAPGVTTTATGTLSFDKTAGTYNVSMDQPILSYSILTLSNSQGFTGYNIGGTTPVNNQPPVSVANLAQGFYVQFTGYAESGSGTGALNLQADSVPFPAANANLASFVNDSGELFWAGSSWVSVSQGAAGVAGDTLQKGEVLDLDFFTSNPQGDTSMAPTATAAGIYLKFDGVGSEDLVVVLKLVDATDGSQITRAFVVDNSDIFKTTASLPPGYNITLDNNDGVVIFESNDFNFAGEDWLIEGAQILVSTEGVSGTAYNLNHYTTGSNVTGDNDGATSTTPQLIFSDVENEKANSLSTNERATWDNDVLKIIDMGFLSTATSDAHLTFDVQVQDTDGDLTGIQTINVWVDADGIFM